MVRGLVARLHFVARELAPVWLRSSRKACACGVSGRIGVAGFGAAAQPSGSKLPRHRGVGCFCSEGIHPRSAAQQSQSLCMRCVWMNWGGRVWGRCAAQRGWIPSPQGWWRDCILWLGSLLPFGCAAVVKPVHAVCLEELGWQGLGLLRSPAGASSLATGRGVLSWW